MKVDKRIKSMPWPEPYKTAGNQDFAVTLNWPNIAGERVLVATFSANREKKRWKAAGQDFRLICSKKNNTAAVLYKGDRAGKRHGLNKALGTFACNSASCYPEITERDEAALAKWLRSRGTNNHLMPELATWVEDALETERMAERDARGELRDEDVEMCPDELPEGLVEYIRREVLLDDNILLYKHGNVRGTCFKCRRKVKAAHLQRFRQNEVTLCPECGEPVVCVLEGSERFKADYVADITTIQKGSDGATLFIRQWHLCRDCTAEWGDIPAQLDEVARYAVRGNRAAKWQSEAKENWYMNTTRYKLDGWTRVESLTAVYDGEYRFFLPPDWAEILRGTSLQYCDLAGYLEDKQHSKNPIRFMIDWGRYPAIEKFWKAGYTGIVHERIRGLWKRHQYAVSWQKETIQEAIRFPFRFLKTVEPGKWDMDRMQKTADAWRMAETGAIMEREVMELVEMPCEIEMVERALRYASVHKVAAYMRKNTEREREERRKAEERAGKNGGTYWEGRYPLNAPQTYRDYIRDAEQLGLDLTDKAVLFPRDLNAAHQRTIAQLKHKHSEEEKRAFQETIRNRAALEWEQDGLIIRLPHTADEMTAEGAALHHCVGGYVEDVAKGKTTILFIRDSTEPDKPFYTLEWRDGRVIQCRTEHNRTYTSDKRVEAFVNAWVDHIEKKMKSKKKTAAAA